jgi:hypothetical protein
LGSCATARGLPYICVPIVHWGLDAAMMPKTA